MKIELERLLENLREHRYECGDEALVVYELIGNGIGMHREQYVSLTNCYGNEFVEDLNKILRTVRAVSNNIGVLFDGWASLFNIMYSDTLGEFLGSGQVKAIRAGYHFDEEMAVESIDPRAMVMVHTMFNMILERAHEFLEELNLTRYAICELTAMHLAEGFGSYVNMEYLVLSDLRCLEHSFTILV
jgi:preprotein translocase subunit Sec61beta